MPCIYTQHSKRACSEYELGMITIMFNLVRQLVPQKVMEITCCVQTAYILHTAALKGGLHSNHIAHSCGYGVTRRGAALQELPFGRSIQKSNLRNFSTCAESFDWKVSETSSKPVQETL